MNTIEQNTSQIEVLIEQQDASIEILSVRRVKDGVVFYLNEKIDVCKITGFVIDKIFKGGAAIICGNFKTAINNANKIK